MTREEAAVELHNEPAYAPEYKGTMESVYWSMAITERIARRKAEAQVEKLRQMSTAEIMCENESVNQHIKEWEERCLRAEERVKGLEAERDSWVNGADAANRACVKNKEYAEKMEARVKQLEEQLRQVNIYLETGHWPEEKP